MLRRSIFFSVLGALIVGALFLTADPATAASCNLTVGGDYVCDARPDADPFAVPKPIVDSFLNEVTYVRLADFTNVYDSPGGRIVRNAGDGFLFVTIYGAAQVGEQLWYQINPAEYVHANDLILTDISEFSGIEVNIQPERPFGWIVLEVRPSDEPDGEANEDFRELGRYSFVQVFDAVRGEGDWLWYDIGRTLDQTDTCQSGGRV